MKHPWPDGYRFWVLPNYRIETPKICVTLSPMRGAMLAKLLTRYGRAVPNQEMFDTFYGKSIGAGPTILTVQMTHLRQQLKQYGINANIRFDHCSNGYVLRGFEECAPEPGRFRERTVQSTSIRHRAPKSSTAIPAPRNYGYVSAYCDDVSWALHARHEQAEQMTLEKIAHHPRKRAF